MFKFYFYLVLFLILVGAVFCFAAPLLISATSNFAVLVGFASIFAAVCIIYWVIKQMVMALPNAAVGSARRFGKEFDQKFRDNLKGEDQ